MLACVSKSSPKLVTSSVYGQPLVQVRINFDDTDLPQQAVDVLMDRAISMWPRGENTFIMIVPFWVVAYARELAHMEQGIEKETEW